ncbi:MAG TPA: CBS domain-containing protein, partial [Kamptonema sp.]|nr:CBS domain-containing protein [Kamptonema sp.]
SPFLTASEATVMALGIHVDTGSLTYEGTSARDAAALAWLMEQGASLRVIAEYVEPGLSPQLQDLLTVVLENLQLETLRSYTVGSVLLTTDTFVPGLSSLASRLLDLTDTDALLLANTYGLKESGSREKENSGEGVVSNRLTIIGRSRIEGTNLNELFQSLGGGGHTRAASASLRNVDPKQTLKQLVEQLKTQIPHPPIARDLMSSPVRTIRPETSIAETHRILLRYGHSGLCVVDDRDRLVGIISRRDIDIALHHGFSHAPVKGYMTPQLKTIAPDTTLPEIESLMVTYDIGRLPVLDNNQLVGIVSRTDVLRELHQQKQKGKQGAEHSQKHRELPYCPLPEFIQQLLAASISPQLQQFLSQAANIAEKRGWKIYLVGGAVRDLLLATPEKNLSLTDIDLVVDGYKNLGLGKTSTHQDFSVPKAQTNNYKSPAVELASALQKLYPAARLEVHGQFQTAALLWHKDPEMESLWVDIATARTEFYPYPAANPEVEASSIRQDLYRRDFTINALAVRLTANRTGELLDFFGGLQDLQTKQIRVLHANSFIEDPTRIYRAVRFAARLGFQIEPQTERYIRHALQSGIYERVQGDKASTPALQTRLKSELKYILQATYWQPAMQMLGDLKALRCIHPTLELDRGLRRQLRLVECCLKGRQNAEPGTINNYQLPININDWQLRLEVLIAYLAPKNRGKVAANLQLPIDSIKRLEDLEEKKTKVVATLLGCEMPSDLVLLLRQYDLSMLILVAVQSPRKVRRQIWQYLTKWVNFEPFLNGNDLKALGYKPGPKFKQMLDRLLVAALDGIVRDRVSAISFMAAHYPQSSAL